MTMLVYSMTNVINFMCCPRRFDLYIFIVNY